MPSEQDITLLAPFEIICSDIIGKLRMFTNKKEYYIALFVDLRTGYVVTYQIRQKSQLLRSIIRLFRDHVTKYGHNCKRLHSDYESVYRDADVVKWLEEEQGVESTYSAPYHHQANGVAERTVRKLLDLARTLMIEAMAPLSDTDLYINLATWYINRSPNKKLKDKTPFEAVTGRKPDMRRCVPVGSTAYVTVTKEEAGSRHKMEPRAIEGKLVGYPDDVNGAYLIKTKGGKMVIRRDVRFNDYDNQDKQLENEETKMLYSEENWKNYAFSLRNEDAFSELEAANKDEDIEDELDPPVEILEDGLENSSEENVESSEQDNTTDDGETNSESSYVSQKDNDSDSDEEKEDPNDTNKLPVVERDNVEFDDSKIRKKKSGPRKPRKKNSCEQHYPDNWFRRELRSGYRKTSVHYVLKPNEDVKDIITPENCFQALNNNNPYREEWLKAINKEMTAILEMDVFEDITPEEARKVRAFSSKFFAFKVKKEADGSVTFKARLVVKGFSQKYGVDYDETFAPTITFGTILMILHIGSTLEWHVTGCDIGNAYLEALTNRELFMELPIDYTGYDNEGNPKRVIVRLKRKLYGSKQAALMWYGLLTKVLIGVGFKRSKCEPCCFIIEIQWKRSRLS
jgi:hypothetical protein